MHKARLERASDLFLYIVSSQSFMGVDTDYTTYAHDYGDLERIRTVDMVKPPHVAGAVYVNNIISLTAKKLRDIAL